MLIMRGAAIIGHTSFFVVNTSRALSAAGKVKIYITNIIKFFNYANF